MGFWEVTLSLLDGLKYTCLIFALTLVLALPLGLVISFGFKPVMDDYMTDYPLVHTAVVKSPDTYTTPEMLLYIPEAGISKLQFHEQCQSPQTRSVPQVPGTAV